MTWYLVDLRLSRKLVDALKEANVMFDQERANMPREINGFSFPDEYIPAVRKLLDVPSDTKNVFSPTDNPGIKLLEFKNFDMSKLVERFRADDTPAVTSKASASPRRVRSSSVSKDYPNLAALNLLEITLNAQLEEALRARGVVYEAASILLPRRVTGISFGHQYLGVVQQLFVFPKEATIEYHATDIDNLSLVEFCVPTRIDLSTVGTRTSTSAAVSGGSVRQAIPSPNSTWYLVELPVTQKLATVLREENIMYDRESVMEPRPILGISFPAAYLRLVRKQLGVPETSRNVFTSTDSIGIDLVEFENFDMSQVEARFTDPTTTS